MQILNLINKEKSDIDYSISRFPDGEVQITCDGINHKDEVLVKCRITSAEDLFIIMQVSDILNRHAVVWWLDIYYLMGSRMDRVMDFNRPFTLKIMANTLNGLGAFHVNVFEPHSERCSYEGFYQAISLSKEVYETLDKFDSANIVIEEEYCLIIPDKGAYNRLRYNTREHFYDNAVVMNKVRNIATGKIEKIEVTNPDVVLSNNKFIIVDDLCDGGGTFCGIASEIRKINPNAELSIFVTHMVNPRGIENLSKTFDRVWFTNSYKDWKEAWGSQPTPFPENVTQIDVV